MTVLTCGRLLFIHASDGQTEFHMIRLRQSTCNQHNSAIYFSFNSSVTVSITVFCFCNFSVSV